MVARDKFKVGGRVKLTSKGIKALGRDRLAPNQKVQYDAQLHGTVTGFTRSPSAVQIERDGTVMPQPYHMDYWEPVDDGEPAR
jgi:hypothetical protein